MGTLQKSTEINAWGQLLQMQANYLKKLKLYEEIRNKIRDQFRTITNLLGNYDKK